MEAAITVFRETNRCFASRFHLAERSCLLARPRGAIQEFRIYEAVEGKASALRSPIMDEVAPKFFSRHGIELLGAFVGATEDGASLA
jgi:hypothetical protein